MTTLFPLSALLFLVFLGIVLIGLFIIYQLLKRDMCCKVEGTGGTDEEDSMDAGDALLNENGEPGIPDGTDAVINIEDTPAAADATDTGPAATIDPDAGGEDMVNVPGDLTTLIDTSVAGTSNFVPPPPDDPEPLALAGKLMVEFTYISGAEKLNVLIIRASDLPEKDRGGAANIVVHMTILPLKKPRFRTKVIPSSKAVFNERFVFEHVTPDIIEDCALRLRLYGKERFSRRVIGEVNVMLKALDTTSPLSDEPKWLMLLPKGIVAELANYIERDSDEDPEPDGF